MINVEITINEVEMAAFEHQLTTYSNPMTHAFTEVQAQAAQTSFVIYIHDSLVLRFEPFNLRECMKMVRKSL